MLDVLRVLCVYLCTCGVPSMTHCAARPASCARRTAGGYFPDSIFIPLHATTLRSRAAHGQ